MTSSVSRRYYDRNFARYKPDRPKPPRQLASVMRMLANAGKLSDDAEVLILKWMETPLAERRDLLRFTEALSAATKGSPLRRSDVEALRKKFAEERDTR